jgi:hypothetical protein
VGAPQREQQSGDIVVIQPHKAFTCENCGGPDDLLTMENHQALCLTCADLAHLVWLPSGDAALTRRARKLSALSAVVVRFSRTRRRYERQGVLVEAEALDQAEEQCLHDADLRARRHEREQVRRAAHDVVFQRQLADEIQRLFPRCPPERAEAIATHAGTRGSGRVGRSAAGQAFEANAVTAAVVASIRHTDTQYDELLMKGVSRLDARERVRADIDVMLEQWRG